MRTGRVLLGRGIEIKPREAGNKPDGRKYDEGGLGSPSSTGQAEAHRIYQKRTARAT